MIYPYDLIYFVSDGLMTVETVSKPINIWFACMNSTIDICGDAYTRV